MTDWPLLELKGKLAYKAVPRRCLTDSPYRRIAETRDLEILDALEALTDDCARDEMGMLELVPQRERARLGRNDPAMAAFTRFNRSGCTFSDGSYGVHYLHLEADTALRDAQQVLAAFLAAGATAPVTHELTLYRCELNASIADLRGCKTVAWLHPTPESLALSRELGRRLRAAGIAGALYPSARIGGAESLALFDTSALLRSSPQLRISTRWNGSSMEEVARTPVSD